MSTSDEPTAEKHSFSVTRVFTPSQAAKLLRRMGLEEMTECALRTRAYRRQIPFHVNGRRIMFTLTDLREIAEGRAYRPRCAESENNTIQRVPRTPRRVPRRAQEALAHDAWRARRPRDA